MVGGEVETVFAHTSNSMLPVMVCDKKGKPQNAVVVQLIIDKPKKGEAEIVQVKVKLDKD